MLKPRTNIAGNWEVGVPAHVACPKLVPLRLVIASEIPNFRPIHRSTKILEKAERKLKAEVEMRGEKEVAGGRATENTLGTALA